jgi:hypothetical protein
MRGGANRKKEHSAHVRAALDTFSRSCDCNRDSFRMVNVRLMFVGGGGEVRCAVSSCAGVHSTQINRKSGPSTKGGTYYTSKDCGIVSRSKGVANALFCGRGEVPDVEVRVLMIRRSSKTGSNWTWCKNGACHLCARYRAIRTDTKRASCASEKEHDLRQG